jgi:hypothetical protein
MRIWKGGITCCLATLVNNEFQLQCLTLSRDKLKLIIIQQANEREHHTALQAMHNKIRESIAIEKAEAKINSNR